MEYFIIFENNTFIIAKDKQEMLLLKDMYERENIKIRIERFEELCKKAFKEENQKK